ncbi:MULTISPECIES: glycosyltransferase [Alcaligenes]|uniref:glycosyltransferase n=1 Tax=Alcaligenes TaxID=507 RepID=UPI0002AAA3BD|nr:MULTISPECIES: glycosyltransferase [Alcaligenes]EKU29965.1 group 1 glycosyl transferase [Alcaligenes sp. HPC1271]ERI32559.1 hypothetical protein N879_12380 [Alcaligenes sp. EGD-AK7]HRO20457.1 glycosyltransferase [Alcaligenes phenolicus]HRP14152.1 glycosyltransferase [Alcaligenes phenolicus]
MSSVQDADQAEMAGLEGGKDTAAFTHFNQPMLGHNGEDLTLVVRMEQGLQGALAGFMASLWQAMPEFAGEIILVHGVGAQEAMDGVSAEYAARYRIRSREVEDPGTMAAVQDAIELVHTRWVFLLTDHVVFVRNPLDMAIAEMSSTGSHFLSFHASVRGVADVVVAPRFIEMLFLNGRSLAFLNSTRESVFNAVDTRHFRRPYLSLDACLMFVPSWKRLGRFDSGLMGQYADFDFSLRVFRDGLKAVFVPDGGLEEQFVPDLGNNPLVEAPCVDARFAELMKREYGIDVCGALDPREIDQQLESYRQEYLRDWMGPLYPESIPSAVSSRPRIALIIDSEYWAFANIARQIVRYLSHKYEFVVIPSGVVNNLSQILLMCQGCDIAHFFWREYLTLIDSQYFKDYNYGIGYSEADFYARYIAPLKLTGAVYDHLFLTEPEIQARRRLFMELMCGYTVSSRRLQTIYTQIDGYPEPTQETADGVDLTLFRPKNLERFDSIGLRPLVVGWAGNSKWASEQEDFKGFHSVFMPAIEQLRAEGLEIELHLADRQLGFISHHDMPDYYARIDLYICPSKIEGTPNPVLESMACGVPVLSTDVGIVPEAFGPRQMDFIFERSIEGLVEKLRYFYINRQELAPVLSRENLESIKNWDWSEKTKNFELFFDKILAS